MPGIKKPGREFCGRPRLKLGCSARVVIVDDDDDITIVILVKIT